MYFFFPNLFTPHARSVGGGNHLFIGVPNRHKIPEEELTVVAVKSRIHMQLFICSVHVEVKVRDKKLPQVHHYVKMVTLVQYMTKSDDSQLPDQSTAAVNNISTRVKWGTFYMRVQPFCLEKFTPFRFPTL